MSEFFRQHTAYLFENRERIWADPELSAAFSPEMRVIVAYITGGGLFPLGLLLDLWAQDSWTASCDSCAGKVLIHRIGGSPLSGNRKWQGVCIGCNALVESSIGPGGGPRGKTFVEACLLPVVELRKKWNVDEDFAFERMAEQDPGIQRIDVQGGMTLPTDEGPIDMQIGFSSWDEFAGGGADQGPLQPTIPIEEVIPRLRQMH